MRFSEILAQAGIGPYVLAGEAQVGRVVLDSRAVQKGDCFVAVPGAANDGHSYIPAAIKAGASAVVCQHAAAIPAGLAHAVVPDTHAVIGPLAQAALDWPARKLTKLAVTGTNGKTTFTYLARHLLEAAGAKAALLGTISYEIMGQSIPAPNTTPDAAALAAMMADAVNRGGTHLVMEVSSHALQQGRTNGLDFQAAAFTNLTGDHLDYHGSMASYLSAKRKLFESLSPAAYAVLNAQDPASDALANSTAAKVIDYAIDAPADLSAKIVSFDSSGSQFLLHWRHRQVKVQTHLIGRHNVANCLAAAGTALALGMELEAVAVALGSFGNVPGRLQRVPAQAGFEVFVDYAHTDDGLANVLWALRAATRGKLIVVFGCGGNRDRTKRPRMAAVAEKWADEIIVTSDNPRHEQPMEIIQEILTGFSAAGRSKVQVEVDRRVAIGMAIASAGPGDVVLLAGKGHEDYQIIGDKKIHFDDAETAAEMLSQRTYSSDRAGKKHPCKR